MGSRGVSGCSRGILEVLRASGVFQGLQRVSETFQGSSKGFKGLKE